MRTTKIDRVVIATERRSLVLQCWEPSTEIGPRWWAPQSSVQCQKEYIRTRAQEGFSRHMSQQREMPAISAKLVLCQSPEDWDQRSLQTLLASMVLNVYLPWLSSPPQCSLHKRRSGKWTNFETAIQESADLEACTKIHHFYCFQEEGYQCTSLFWHGIWRSHSSENLFHDLLIGIVMNKKWKWK